ATGVDAAVREAFVERTWYDVTLDIRGEWRQKRREVISATIESDVQALFFDDDEAAPRIDVQAEDVIALELMPWGSSSYFQTPRGRESFAHLLARGRALLALSARAVE